MGERKSGGDDGFAAQIGDAVKVHFGSRATVTRFQNAVTSDKHGVILVEIEESWLVSEWRVRHDDEIGFRDEEAGLSAEEAEREYDRRVQLQIRVAEAPTVRRFDEGPDEELLDIGVEEAMSELVDCAGERYLVLLEDADGREVASIAGPMIPPEKVEWKGASLTRFGVCRDGYEATVRLPMDPDSQCTLAPDGTLTGELPNGASWSITALE